MSEKVRGGKFHEIISLARSAKGTINISGVSEGRAMPVAALIAKERKSQSLIVTSSYTKAKRLAEDLSFFVDQKIYVIPEEEQLFFKYEAKSHGALEERLTALKAFMSGESCIVISPVLGAVKKLAPHGIFQNNTLQFHLGVEEDIETIKRKLTYMGYERAAFVESKGQYGIRGGIIDIFPADSPSPYRIEFFDTEVDSIRTFDPITQRSLDNLKTVEIYPAEQMVQEEELFQRASEKLTKAYESHAKKLKGELKEKLLNRKNQLVEFIESATNVQLLENYIHYFYEDTEYLWDYMKPDSVVMVEDPDRVREVLEFREQEDKEDFKVILEKGEAVPGDFQIYPNKSDLEKLYGQNTVFLFTPFQKQIKGIQRLDASIHVSAKQAPVFNGKMDFLETELKRYAKQNYDITIVCSTEERVENLKSFVERCDLLGQVKLLKGSLTSGLEFSEERLVYLWDGDIFTTQKHRKAKSEEKKGKPIKAFTDIRKGDYVVHENHGIGKFIGVEQLVIQKVKKDYLKIKYAGEDMLYIPVEQMDMIQKYIGADGSTPKINKLSSGEWKKTKAKAKAAILNMAKELLELSAERKARGGYAFSPDTIWQREFEDMFPYEETADQLRCIKEIKADMEKPISMERLLCGDVGYGKTEVAARAIFKCAADGKQAAVLVPTTILANQHYYTFKDRFEKFPFKVEMLSRFRNEKQQETIIEKVKQGSIDVLVGTHRMLSKDIGFKDLGLLVIDEEQRFGVQHKEAIKKLRTNVDVLTLSATPIPRTLHMSLLGIKDMSLIEEPPEERYPVQTYVLEQDDELLRDVIQRELDRDGQVYVVYNRVRGIHKIAALISDLVPEAIVAVGHGQMNEKQLEDVMIDFVNHESNVLLATTIIESGIDIPNVNTIIILDADRFGLSQLYQLRGRVGRSNRMAYAYLMYQKDKVLSEHAEKRLRAIKEFTEFGAGFRIAMRDLEIRGAGNLLGTEQHGHMMMVGYELYCKLLEDAVRALGGEIVNPEREETSVEIDVPAYIPDTYIADEILKLQMYKKIAAIKDGEDEVEITDELMDRFGEMPKETENLIKISYIRALAEKAGILRIHEEPKKIVFDFHEKNMLSPQAMANLSQKYGMNLLIHAGVKPFIKCNISGKNKLHEIIIFLSSIV
ncbi:transcription-repair coupling factor [Sinanaerobacter chloroacetimidivorans]|uniref:Transcription-repair-coupling factor n=1 Tax=Sinanaerobacter chloroacetimidivorans TaxID=2818044 RepID=A0A8J7W4Q1_9FIRM|nr:transcription-repair coupling factor [Sinanaerobacter chloroacetimidivorans]MBR0600439.1 transcription-repair coupling factor [Sinanaerobacter chloroacetimidivorans]